MTTSSSATPLRSTRGRPGRPARRAGRRRAQSVSGGMGPSRPPGSVSRDRAGEWAAAACGKVGRGELLEVLEYLAFLRSHVLGPLGMRAAGLRGMGVRRVELDAPELAGELRRTVAGCERG